VYMPSTSRAALSLVVVWHDIEGESPCLIVVDSNMMEWMLFHFFPPCLT
jgi:hypothetical protein